MIVTPDYDKSILSTTASLYRKVGAPCAYPTLPALDEKLKDAPDNIAFILLDGLGANLIERFLPENSFFRRNRIDTVTSVYPPTTTAATTSYWSGLSPLEHGWLGWSLYFKEYGRIIDTFIGRDSITGEKVNGPFPATTLMPFKSVYELMGGEYDSWSIHPFDTYATHGVKHVVEAATYEAQCAELKKITRLPGKKLITCYQADPDHTMHAIGVNVTETRDLFREMDRLSEALVNSCENTLFIFTADHGLIDSPDQVVLNDYPALCDCLIMPPSIETRGASLFVKAGKRDFFRAEFTRLFGDRFRLYSREDAVALFGRGTPHKKSLDFIGDFVACAAANTCLVYRALNGHEFRLIGQHAGLTEDEMRVPVIAVTR